MVVGGGLTDGTVCKLVTRGQAEDMHPLFSDHEEADSRLLLHAKHTAAEHKRVIIDT